jgi:hypothetical protein
MRRARRRDGSGARQQQRLHFPNPRRLSEPRRPGLVRPRVVRLLRCCAVAAAWSTYRRKVRRVRAQVTINHLMLFKHGSPIRKARLLTAATCMMQTDARFVARSPRDQAQRPIVRSPPSQSRHFTCVTKCTHRTGAESRAGAASPCSKGPRVGLNAACNVPRPLCLYPRSRQLSQHHPAYSS